MVFRKEHMIVAVFLTILSSVMAMLADPVCDGTDDNSERISHWGSTGKPNVFGVFKWMFVLFSL